MFGRFPFKRSIQYALGIVDKPVVNYYFVEIANGIKQFCDKEKIAFEKKKLFQNFGFMLTHDVDRVDAYNYYNVGYIFKQLIGLSTPDYNKIKTLKVFISSFYHFINIFSKKNPFWSFEFLRQVEKDNNFKSVFYFLKNEGKLDARYSIREKRIINLLGYLSEEGCEIGLHGTMNSALHFESMNNALKELKQVTQREIIGCRQHFLKFHLPETMLIQEKCNIKYDSTLCFAEHDGFRNSYCLPFKLYHFDENRMMDVWEIPLNTMEVTLFGYRKLSFKEANDSVIQLISEIKKFNGIFTLLWHNCFYDENKYKGIRYFYEQLIFNIRKEMPENVLGKELVVTLNREHKKNIF
jgi:hypothetical protein